MPHPGLRLPVPDALYQHAPDVPLLLPAQRLPLDVVSAIQDRPRRTGRRARCPDAALAVGRLL